MPRCASLPLSVFASAFLLAATSAADSLSAKRWSWTVCPCDNVLQISYGSGTDFPQYGALHLKSSYLRLVPSRACGWGPSVILLPVVWEVGKSGPTQGAPVEIKDISQSGGNLVIRFTGSIAGLDCTGVVTVSPPNGLTIRAVVELTVTGSAQLGNHPGEAFRPAMMPSMHCNDTEWDAQAAIVDGREWPVPVQGLIFSPTTTGRVFGFRGGTSRWKVNSPTVLVDWGEAAQIMGWVVPYLTVNDDNLSIWAGFDQVVPHWRYVITARKPDPSPALSWVGTSGLTADGVAPDSGQADRTRFRFAAKATDPKGDLPQYVRLYLRRNGKGWRAVDLRAESGSMRTGRVYSTTMTLPAGSYRYRFDGRDDDGFATGPPTVFRAGPTVRSSASALTLSGLAASPGQTGGAEIRFRLSASAIVRAEVLSLAGRPVAVLQPRSERPSGPQTLLWDGRSAAGTVAPAGCYLLWFEARAADGSVTRALAPLSVRR